LYFIIGSGSEDEPIEAVGAPLTPKRPQQEKRQNAKIEKSFAP
jgi:hypothetical protein